MERKESSVLKYPWKNEVILAGLLTAFAFFVNRGIRISGLYMDDLYLWYCYWEQSFFQYVFPVGSTRFRFLHYLAAYLEQTIVGARISWLVPINILLNSLVAYGVLRFGRRLSKSSGIGFLCGILYLLSRMSYYQISQVSGLMETMALAAALGLLYCLYRYLHDESGGVRYMRGAVWLYFAAAFIHERFMALFPVLLLALAFTWKRTERKKRLWLWGETLGIFILIQLIRLAALGSLSPAGTGGTNVADTFTLKAAVSYALSQAAYLFGVNAGPEHLNGMPWAQSPRYIKLLVAAADAVLLAVTTGFAVELLKNKRRRWEYGRDALLFAAFIAMCIASSSVTVRVELRWVYVSYTAALLLLAYMFGAVCGRKKGLFAVRRFVPWGLLCLCYGLLMFPVEGFYRGQYDRLYLWPGQTRSNSLADETYGRYGEDIFGKKIYIMGNSYNMSDFDATAFFRVYNEDAVKLGTEVFFIDDIRNIGQVKENMVVLREDPAQNGYQDVTDFVRALKCQPLEGYYRDGWMDESARLRVMAGSTGKIELELLYPGQISGGETAKIYVDGGPQAMEVPILENITRAQIVTEPYAVAELSFENNFYMQDAKEQRGEKRLSMIVNITAD